MGRFRAKAVMVRRVNDLEIVFYNRETIYVGNMGKWYIFHRWFAPRGSYNGGWRQFRHLLLYEKGLDLTHCYRLAFLHDIQAQIAGAPPDLSKFKIQERFD